MKYPEKLAIILLTVISLVLCFVVFMLNLEIKQLREIDYRKSLKISQLEQDAVYTQRVTKNVVQLLNRAGGL